MSSYQTQYKFDTFLEDAGKPAKNLNSKTCKKEPQMEKFWGDGFCARGFLECVKNRLFKT